jgi:cell division protein FtsQ
VPRLQRSHAVTAELASTARARTLLPSARSVAVGLVLALAALAAYVAARESSAFALRTITVRSADPGLAAGVRETLEPLLGTSLLALDGEEVERLATALPQVSSVEYDRAFPHGLVLTIEAERPLAVVRHGSEAWLVSRRARIVKRLQPGGLPGLPRIWLPRAADVRLGGTLSAGAGAEQVAALRPVAAARLRGRVAQVRLERGQITYVLRGGLELRAGRPANLDLKLEVARRILERVALSRYLDVSVPARPVAGATLDSQVEVEG